MAADERITRVLKISVYFEYFRLIHRGGRTQVIDRAVRNSKLVPQKRNQVGTRDVAAMGLAIQRNDTGMLDAINRDNDIGLGH